jgi:hypothetical protein
MQAVMDGPRAGNKARLVARFPNGVSAHTSKVSRRETAETPPESAYCSHGSAKDEHSQRPVPLDPTPAAHCLYIFSLSKLSLLALRVAPLTAFHKHPLPAGQRSQQFNANALFVCRHWPWLRTNSPCWTSQGLLLLPTTRWILKWPSQDCASNMHTTSLQSDRVSRAPSTVYQLHLRILRALR